jgi:DNA-directed RNA polymerase subunit F
MEIINEDDVSAIEAKRILEDRKKDKELLYEQKICLEYLEKVPKPTAAKLKTMMEELSKISILKPRYIALILNILPDTEDEVNMLFSKERTNLKKEEVKQIVEIVAKYK